MLNFSYTYKMVIFILGKILKTIYVGEESIFCSFKKF